MDSLLAARLTMAFSLGFHIIFASVGMVMPFFLATSYFHYLRRKDPTDLKLTKMWSQGVAILFATGAVSGTVLSFELGLLWPDFMKLAGATIGLPFAWEGAAFFLEAIALGLFLYGWNRIPPWVHWGCALVIGISGVASGVFVISANGWMNAPTGFHLADGKFIDVDPIKAMFNSAWLHEALHMLVASFQAVGLSVGGIHALLYLRNRKSLVHKRAMEIALIFGAVASVIQPVVGDLSAKWVASHQPAKFAAMESLHQTQTEAPFKIVGLEIPGLLSWLAFGSTSAEVKGLDDIPVDERPNESVVHTAFQVMVILGTLLAGLGAVYLFYFIRRKQLPDWLLKSFVVGIPLGWIALEAGWIVTEVGRQPWIIYGVMKTANAVTPVPGMQYRMWLFIFVYALLSFVVTALMLRQFRASEGRR